MSERIGFRPRMESQRGFSQSRGKERIPFKETRYDQQENEYVSYVESMDKPDRKTFKDFWNNLKPHEKVGFGMASVATFAAVAFGAMEGMEAFDKARFGEPQKPVIIDLSDPSIPGHDNVAPDTSEPSVTVTSSPPGKAPLTITLPTK